MREMTNNCKNELIPDTFVQSENAMLKQESRAQLLNTYLSNILTKLGKEKKTLNLTATN